jgi:hypothetical protein
MTRLLYYLKKDTGLVVTTAEYQLRLSELISETYNLIVNDVGANITAILEQAMLEHDPITDLEQVDFTDDWQRFFRRSTSRRSTMDDTQMQRQSSQFDHSEPRTITNILTSTLYVLQSYEVHSTVIIQCLAQFFHTLSCELFNRMLTKKKYLSRSKALQVRMNLSVVEDWIRKNNLPSSMIGYLNPSVQLLQLLQCLTQLTDIESFKSTIEEFDTVNPLQIKRCVLNYRYETNENRLPEMIETYVNQCAEETIKFKQTRSSRTLERNSIQSIQSQSLRRSLSARDSMSQIMGSFMSTHPAETNTNTDENEVEDKEIKETKDSRFMLPFMVPTTAQLAHVSGWSHRKEDKVTLVPVVPEEWMDKLDKNNKL